MDDRFSFEDEFGAEPEEESAQEGRGTNRVFTIMAIGLIGLIVVGALGVIGYLVLIRPNQQAQIAAQNTQVIAEATIAAQETAMAPTDTPLPTDTPEPTGTPEPTPTPKATHTRVIAATATPLPGAIPTPTRTPVGGGQTPQTGFGGLTAVLAATALAVVVFVARKLRLA